MKGRIWKRAEYAYNAFGNRIGQAIYSGEAKDGIPDMGSREPKDPEKQIRYTIDLTKQYHNVLMSEDNVGGKTQTFYWDGNVAGVAGSTDYHYYLQDDLGSPIRLLDESGELVDSYGYDEFGQDLYGNQGIMQPFGYTGYQSDQIAGTYFAQMREYKPDLGRFAGQDIIKGSIDMPYHLNDYEYCWGNPLVWVDLNALFPGFIENISRELTEGNEAHRLLQLEFLKEYGMSGGRAEFYIEEGIERNITDTGRADIVYMNAATQTAEVYEIKSGSYSPGKPNNAKGIEQMMEYVTGLQKSSRLPEGWKSAPGYTLNSYFSGKVIESKLYEGKKEIVYNVYQNGMIIYYYRDKQEEGELEPSTIPVPQKEEERQRNWEKLLTPVGILAVTAVVGLFVVNLLENVLTGGIGIADDALCYSLMAAIILAVVGTTNEVHGTEDCKAMS